MIIRFERYERFSQNAELRIGWLTLTFSRFEDHFYFQVYWMRPRP